MPGVPALAARALRRFADAAAAQTDRPGRAVQRLAWIRDTVAPATDEPGATRHVEAWIGLASPRDAELGEGAGHLAAPVVDLTRPVPADAGVPATPLGLERSAIDRLTVVEAAPGDAALVVAASGRCAGILDTVTLRTELAAKARLRPMAIRGCAAGQRSRCGLRAMDVIAATAALTFTADLAQQTILVPARGQAPIMGADSAGRTRPVEAR